MTITGTSADYVRKDINEKLDNAVDNGNKVSSKILSSLVSSNRFTSNGTFFNANELLEKYSEGDIIPITLFNSLGQKNKEIIKIDLSDEAEKYDFIVRNVKDQKTKTVTRSAKAKNKLNEKWELYFISETPATGFSTYEIEVIKKKTEKKEKHNFNSGSIISNSHYEIYFNEETQTMEKITNKISGVFSTNVKFNVGYYTSWGDTFGDQASGAYIFRPKEIKKPNQLKPQNTYYDDNELFTEVVQVFSNYSSIRFKLYKVNDDETNYNGFVEMNIKSGVLPKDQEVVLIFDSDINNEGIISYDQNALEKRSKKPITPSPLELVAPNFYPTQFYSFIEEEEKRLTFLSDKSQAVSSRENGNFEIFIHRRTSHFDKKGCHQEVDDEDILFFNARLLLDDTKSSSKKMKEYMYTFNQPTKVFLSNREWWSKDYESDYSFEYSFLKKEFPKNTHFLSFNKIREKEDVIIFRIAHIFEKNEDEELSKSVEIDISEYFTKKIMRLNETSLTDLNDRGECSSKIKLNPIQIKTYKVKFS